MKSLLLFLLFIFCITACQKAELIAPNADQNTLPKADTIPDNAGFKIKLYKDSSNYDDVMFLFDHRANAGYDANEDGIYFAGYGQVSLASISADGRDLAINRLPYKAGMSVDLDVQTKTSGTFFLAMTYENKIPGDMSIWLKDAYAKDSVDVRTGTYTFNINKADTNSLGNKRFSLVFREQMK